MLCLCQKMSNLIVPFSPFSEGILQVLVNGSCEPRNSGKSRMTRFIRLIFDRLGVSEIQKLVDAIEHAFTVLGLKHVIAFPVLETRDILERLSVWETETIWHRLKKSFHELYDFTQELEKFYSKEEVDIDQWNAMFCIQTLFCYKRALPRIQDHANATRGNHAFYYNMAFNALLFGKAKKAAMCFKKMRRILNGTIAYRNGFIDIESSAPHYDYEALEEVFLLNQ